MAETESFANEDNAGNEEYEDNRPRGNNLKLWGNLNTMNLNPMIHTNIQNSPYFKTNLVELKTYHEVIDEIYYKVEHLEPWERGSRRLDAQSGMCGGVRGVGTGGIVSTAYCLLYKLYTLKLTRKQLKGLLEHPDSPYLRGLGFMYIRYCLSPEELWTWFSPYLDDTEEIDVRAGGGCKMTIGSMLEQWLVKLEWFSTLFPRIPVPVQKKLEEKLRGRQQKRLPEDPHEPERFRDHTRSDCDNSDRSHRDYRGSRDSTSERQGGGSEYRSRNRRSRSRSVERHNHGRSDDRDHFKNRHRESSFDRDLRKARERQEKFRR